MKSILIRFEASVLLIAVVMTTVSCGSKSEQTNTTQSANTTTQSANTTAANVNAMGPPVAEAPAAVKFTDEELDQLLAPIALYPDPLLAQMIPAATFVDQIVDAQRTLNGKADDAAIANQDWDVSVKSIAHYPPVVKKMADDVDWTTTLGQAYINQPEDVTRSIQRLRLEAYDAGNLVTTKQQEVVQKDNIVTIAPAEPQTIYVPEYNAETVYVEEAPPPEYYDEGISTEGAVAVAALSFGAGLLIGSWLNRDYDYYGYYGPPGVYYHGWSNGPGWVNVNRGYVDVDVNRNVYINDNYRNVNVNRNVVNRNVAPYRTNLTSNAAARNQRATNARVNRQLKRQQAGLRPGEKLDRGRQGDLNRPGGGPDGLRDRPDRAGGSGGSRGRGELHGRGAAFAGDRNRGQASGAGWGHGSRRDGGGERSRASQHQTPNRSTPNRSTTNRTTPNRSSSTPQRSAPSRQHSSGGQRSRGGRR